MSAPGISIVTLSFNQARFLEDCLESVFSQGEGACEYIIVDPGSVDRSREILSNHANRIDTMIMEPDGGPADGLNKGFATATGGVFGYINADDRFAPGALRFVSDFFMNHPDVDVLCGAIRIIDEHGRRAWRGRTADRFDPIRYAAGICTVGQQGTFFRRRAFENAGGFNPANRITWDGELLVDMALHGARFETVHEVLGDFRIYAESITGSNRFREQARSEHERIAEKIRAHGMPLYSPVKRTLSRLFYKANVIRHAGYFLAA